MAGIIKFDDVITYETLEQAYWHCRGGKTERTEVVQFHLQRDELIRRLLRELRNEKYDVRGLFTFTIYEPKRREITANEFRDKMVEYVLSNFVLKPVIGPKLIYDNYATQDGKGTKAALERVEHHIRAFAAENDYSSKDGWILSADIHHFFYEINREICCDLIDKLPLDTKLKRLLHLIIYSIEDFDKSTRGLCIGFQTSQWLAIYYLNGLDHFIKEKLHIKHYGRYVDDFFLFHEDKEYLKQCYHEIENYLLSKLDLTLNPKTGIHRFKDGIDFIGFHHQYNNRTGNVDCTILGSKVKLERKKIKRLNKLLANGEITPDKAMESLTSWHAHASKGPTEASENLYEKAKASFTFSGDKNHKSETVARQETKLIDWDSDGFYVLRPKIKNKDGYNYSEVVHSRDRASRLLRFSMTTLDNPDEYGDEFSKYLGKPIVGKDVYDRKHRKKPKD